MTPQEIFNKVWHHMIAQGKPARQKRLEAVGCRYLTDDGRKCAVGCLIPEETAKIWDAFESPDIQNILNMATFAETGEGDEEDFVSYEIAEFDKDAAKPPAWMYENNRLLGDLQHAHDFWTPETDHELQSVYKTETIKKKLAEAASNHNLSIPEDQPK